jgi:hypothetical protein
MLSFPFSEDALLIGLASSEQMVEDACRLMGSGAMGRHDLTTIFAERFAFPHFCVEWGSL